MVGDGDVTVGKTGERIPFCFEASADELESLVNSGARIHKDHLSHTYYITWVGEAEGHVTIPIREIPKIDLTKQVDPRLAVWLELPYWQS
ncbi:TPA_asm: hypothetical protein [ssRNA phage Gerhypos.1_20]|uniref:Uncharacterized protein n=2 Tax=Fiersviridae TaxID=2842319 RepID=A0A8S5KX88_9VIRU|nr:hypothetical protein QIL03_gp3 [ssRNA phage Gerhypos.1_20]QDH86754.1 MAG: hypothetical protein H1Bulk29353_000003 [Leviviridae sp.]DAD49974.1 TPA_asm: hypothetical protein [ssRNA phage Gerhypos.1_20]